VIPKMKLPSHSFAIENNPYHSYFHGENIDALEKILKLKKRKSPTTLMRECKTSI